MELFAQRHGVRLDKVQQRAMTGSGFAVAGGSCDKVLLVKPLTYMNGSGEAIAPLARYYQVEPQVDGRQGGLGALVAGLGPARSIACSMVSTVSTPKATGMPCLRLTWAMPLAHSPATYSKWGVPPRITAPMAMMASTRPSPPGADRQRDLQGPGDAHDGHAGVLGPVAVEGVHRPAKQALHHEAVETRYHQAEAGTLDAEVPSMVVIIMGRSSWPR